MSAAPGAAAATRDTVPGPPVPSSRWAWPALVVGVSSLAFVLRLAVTLRGGGLFGLGNYDDGVYFSAAAGLVHGRLPYRDFLLLHPPGIAVALAPFAALGTVLSDPVAFAASRIAWMVLGAACAVLVARILRPVGWFAALVGGGVYAGFWPAVYSDRTGELETLGTALTLLALLLLAGRRHSWRLASLAGLCLGLAAAVKIWSALAVVVVVVALALARDPGDRAGTDGRQPGRRALGVAGPGRAGVRRALVVLGGAVVGASLVCLPFFLAAPGAMWRMVVLDQVGRPRGNVGPGTRLTAVLGQGVQPFSAVNPAIVVTAAVLVVCGVLALGVREVRLVLLVGVSSLGLLMVTPSWFPHYASLVAGPLAVCVGAGAGLLVRRIVGRRPRLDLVVRIAVCLAVAVYALPLVRAHVGRAFPGARLGAAAAAYGGCTTTDDPTTLILMDALSANLARGCPLVVDLGGWTYDHPPVPDVPRARYPAFQRYALDYLRSGSTTVSIRFTAGSGFSAESAREVAAWPVVASGGSQYVLRRPGPAR